MALAPGTTFADFRVHSVIAESDSGTLFVADQISTRRRCTLKLMRGTLGPDAWARFAQEAQLGMQLGSGAIATVLSAGVDPKSQMPWVALEPMEGETLGGSVRRRGALSLGEVYEVFRHLCHALGAAHARGIVHRNIDAENVFLVWKPSFSAKLIDLGLSAVLAEAKSGDTSTMVTPIWTAPELADAKKGSIAPTSDIWSLGLLAFYALTGKVFWKDPKFIPSLIQEMLFQPIPAASLRAHELGAAPLPPGFDAWFARCVIREPPARFANATDAWNALEPILRAAAGGQVAVAPAAPPPTNAAPPGASAFGTTTAAGRNRNAGATPAGGGGGLANAPVWLFAVAGVVLGLLVTVVIYFAAK